MPTLRTGVWGLQDLKNAGQHGLLRLQRNGYKTWEETQMHCICKIHTHEAALYRNDSPKVERHVGEKGRGRKEPTLEVVELFPSFLEITAFQKCNSPLTPHRIGLHATRATQLHGQLHVVPTDQVVP